MIVVFTGGRDFKGRKAFELVTSSLADGELTIYVGDCPTGLDAMVRERFPFAKVFKADWDKFGKAAGPMRNESMLRNAFDAYDSCTLPPRILLIAFPEGRGTNGCAAIAKRLGIPVMRVEI